MSSAITVGQEAYQTALEQTTNLGAPSVGFTKSSEPIGVPTVSKQLNTCIQLLVRIATKVEEQSNRIQELEKAVHTLQKGKAPADLLEGLGKLKIGEVKPREQGQLRVFRDPYEILKAAQQKLKDGR